MAREPIRILGVYKVPLEATEWADEGSPHGPHSQDFEHLWLLEVLLDRPERPFKQEEYTQVREGTSSMEWQVAYEERFLDVEGTTATSEDRGTLQRVVFFFHYLDFKKPLRTPYGDLALPAPSPFPDRLRKLVRYISPC